MVVVAQLVRASVCGTEGRGFESRLPPIFLERGLNFRVGTLFFDGPIVGREPACRQAGPVASKSEGKPGLQANTLKKSLNPIGKNFSS